MESTLPVTNNVYGYVFCGDRIHDVKRAFEQQLGISDINAEYKNGILSIISVDMEVEIIPDSDGTFSFKGAIGGEESSVVTILEKARKVLRWSDIDCCFEVYDESLTCIAEIGEQRKR